MFSLHQPATEALSHLTPEGLHAALFTLHHVAEPIYLCYELNVKQTMQRKRVKQGIFHTGMLNAVYIHQRKHGLLCKTVIFRTQTLKAVINMCMNVCCLM